MINGLSIWNARTKLRVGALLCGFASLASAQNAIIVGGGSTLPTYGYAGAISPRGLGPLRANTTGDGSLLGEYAKTQTSPLSISYCQTGSAGGKNVLAGNAPTFNVNAPCSSTGFGATSLGETLAQPHFVGSDLPLSSIDLTNYAAGHVSGQPVQFPAVSGAIAIVFNKTDISGHRLFSLHLTEAQVCRIFSGQIKTWQDPALASALPSGATVAGPIKIIYPSDSSGITFAFSNHLSKACGATTAPPTGTGGNGLGTKFKTDQTYTVATGFGSAPTYFQSYAASLGVPSYPGVATAILDPVNDGAIGFDEVANALLQFTSFATVSGFDPSIYGGAVLPVSVTFDLVVTGVDVNGRPVLGASGLANQCIGIVKPEDYALPASGYPILAVSYLLANSAANGLDAGQVRGVLFSPYNSAVISNVFTIGPSTGLSFLHVNGATPAQIQTKISACVN